MGDSDSGAANGRRLLFLHVEDDPNDAFFVRHAFKKGSPGVTLLTVADGREAQNYLSGSSGYGDRARHPLPDLVLMDLKLPRMTGLEVLEWMKSQPGLKDIPVFILSSSSEQSDVERVQALGANGYLSKQGNINILVEIVRGLVELAAAAQSKVPTDGR